MSVNVKHITNGKKEFYYVSDSLNDTIKIYENKDDIPKHIRHYALDDEPRLWRPDMARIMGIRKQLYPEFPDNACSESSYKGTDCIAESCKYAPEGDWTKCPYFNK